MRISTGLILCAGFGKRVAPLTNTTPKPLLQIKNGTLLENSINFLKKCGIKKIKINTHYLSDEIENFIKKKNYKNEVELFLEKEIFTAENSCFHCGQIGHFIATCPVLKQTEVWHKQQQNTVAAIEERNGAPIIIFCESWCFCRK